MSRNRKPQVGQSAIDFGRGQQLFWIRKATFDNVYRLAEGNETRKIRGATVKSVLRALDDFQGDNDSCWPSYQTIAGSAGISVRQAKRAVKVLQELSMVIVTRRLTSNVYRIVWPNVAAAAEDESEATVKQKSFETAMVTSDLAVEASAAGLPLVMGTQMPQPKPPPGSPRPVTPPPPPPNWTQIAQRAARAGLRDLAVIARARLANVGPDCVVKIIAHYEKNAARYGWGPGCLHFRLRTAHLDRLAPEEGWPDGDGQYRRDSEYLKGKRRKMQQTLAYDQQRRAADKQQAQAAEEKTGHELDALSADELREFARKHLSDFEFKRFLKDPKSPTIREKLLAEITG